MRKLVSLLAGAVMLAAFAVTGARAGGDTVGVLIHTGKPYKKVIAAIEDLGGTVTYKYVNVDGLAAQVPYDAVSKLSGIRGVDAVEKDMIVNLPGARDGVPQTVNFDGQVVSGADLKARFGGELPDTYYSYLSGVTGAVDTFADTAAGAAATVAIIDTGTWDDGFCLAGKVTAGPDFSTDGTAFGGAGGPFDGSDLPSNHWHGTFVGGVIANACAIAVPIGHPIDAHLPPDAKFPIGGGLVGIFVTGMAPAAHLYPIKVFPHTGAGAASFRINAAIDHAITAKTSGTVPIDIINMSLGGGTLFDGRTLQEQLVDAATAAGITVVISSGNEGPSLASVARPGTAYTATTVAAGTTHVHSRILWDVIFGPGAGVAMYPLEERGVADFSNRGPSADGRNAVDIIATGTFNFSLFTPSAGGGLGWASGTSFSAPTVAGAAALLASWRNLNGAKVAALDIKNALTGGAVPIASPGWSFQEQGHGWVNVPNSLALLQSGKKNRGERHDGQFLKPNILTGSETTHTETITLKRGRTHNFLVEITDETESVEIDIDTGGFIDQTGAGPLGNTWEVYVKSAKHGGLGSLIDTANTVAGASITIGDGTITTAGLFGGIIDPAPMEPGIMKVVLEPDWTNNEEELTATVTITRTNGAPQNNAGGIVQTFDTGDLGALAFEVPGGTSILTMEMSWNNDWSRASVNDLDFFVFPAGCAFFDFDCALFGGATLDAPEQVVVEDPAAGTWTVLFHGFSVNVGRDPATFRATFD